MYMLQMILQAICAIAGGFIAAAAACWIAWSMFKSLRHPEWGPCLVLVLALLLFHDRLGRSFFLQMVVLFSGFLAAGCWGEGSVWRARRTQGINRRPIARLSGKTGVLGTPHR